LHYNSAVSGSVHRRFKHRLFPVHSPLLRESQLFSCPPLNDMLKFSGLSYVVEVAHKIIDCLAAVSFFRANYTRVFSRHFPPRGKTECPTRKGGDWVAPSTPLASLFHTRRNPQVQVHKRQILSICIMMMCWSIYTPRRMAVFTQPPFAFRNLSALWNLQVMTLFALYCVLHRSPSRDIHR
jgi:hypothetical protein